MNNPKIITITLYVALGAIFSGNVLALSNPFSKPDSKPSAASKDNTTNNAAPDVSIVGADQVNVDPTLAFFSALSTCTPGEYSEHNTLSDTVGQSMLKHTILGQDHDNCTVVLSTPDNRSMTCSFPMGDLSPLGDQHFMQGILSDTVTEPSSGSVTSDMQWSQLKTDNCTFN